jgi:hypothetical protein
MEERWDLINKRFIMLVSVILAIFISSKISAVTINSNTSGGNALFDPNLESLTILTKRGGCSGGMKYENF